MRIGLVCGLSVSHSVPATILENRFICKWRDFLLSARKPPKLLVDCRGTLLNMKIISFILELLPSSIKGPKSDAAEPSFVGQAAPTS